MQKGKTYSRAAMMIMTTAEMLSLLRHRKRRGRMSTKIAYCEAHLRETHEVGIKDQKYWLTIPASKRIFFPPTENS
jgi:hypothetical protein